MATLQFVPRSERRENNRRSGSDRRGTQRRQVTDRRFSDERHGRPIGIVGHESPAEHVRNAMQLLVSALETDPSLSPANFTHVAESALARLTLALNGLERGRASGATKLLDGSPRRRS